MFILQLFPCIFLHLSSLIGYFLIYTLKLCSSLTFFISLYFMDMELSGSPKQINIKPEQHEGP
jgi:hypothetical protein